MFFFSCLFSFQHLSRTYFCKQHFCIFVTFERLVKFLCFFCEMWKKNRINFKVFYFQKKLYLFSNLPSGFVFSIWIGQLWTRSRPKKEEKISFLKLGGGAATSNSCWESSSPPIFTIIILSTRRHNVFESGHHSFRPTGISFSKAEKCLKVFRWL